ncbi:MAG TPA: hypothetical protein VJ124_05240 [Pyrinomonadaceae bacterium]|nr:hypothetical protein [Pyrinomonadaceae bacterium]
MFLIERTVSPGEERLAEIYMRTDGLFEGHIHRKGGSSSGVATPPESWSTDYEVCALTETLSAAKTIIDEELGL